MHESIGTTIPDKRGWEYRLGHTFSALAAGMMVLTGVIKISHEASSLERFVNVLGYSEALLAPLGVVELVITLLYYLPRTALLGAILLTGYLGGATATELRIGGMIFLPVVTGTLVWAGLFLRDHRVAELLRGRQQQ